MAEIWTILQNNPILLWGGIILGVIIYLIVKHLDSAEEGREAPEPTTLDKIVKPKVKAHLKNRGKQPGEESMFKIGRHPKGIVHTYVDSELPKQLINPNPNERSSQDIDDAETEKVRILNVRPAGRVEKILEQIKQLFTSEDVDRKLYVFRVDSFVDTPGSDMIVDDDVMSYEYGGMEVELSASTRNAVHQAVQSDVSEKLLASLPNYTEKVDFLFPIHSQKVKMEEKRGEQEGDW